LALGCMLFFAVYFFAFSVLLKILFLGSCSTVGGIAQWLGCRSLASRLSLPCSQSMVDRLPYFVGKVSAVCQPISLTQLSIPPGSVNM